MHVFSCVGSDGDGRVCVWCIRGVKAVFVFSCVGSDGDGRVCV